MKWYKHDSNANCDAKLKKLSLKYGMEGYGIYWYCLELIAQNVEKHNLTFELEHDAEIISADTNIRIDLVEEMMAYMVDLQLFESSGGVITCLKMASRTDEYTQKLIKQSENVGMISGQSPRKSELKEENRVDNNSSEKNKRERFNPPTIQEIESYCHLENFNIDAENFFNFYESKGWMIGKNRMKNWRAAVSNWDARDKNQAKGKPTGALHRADELPVPDDIKEKRRKERKEAIKKMRESLVNACKS